MTAICEKTHQRWLTAPVVPLQSLIGGGPILVLAPHPDDETIGCGGLIRQAANSDVPVFIDILTDGSRSHRNSPLYDRTRLAALRQTEALEAVARLGIDSAAVRFWGEEDSCLAEGAGDAERLTAAMRQRIGETGASAVFVTWTDDPHCDHKAAFSLALQGIRGLTTPPRLYAYPVWSWTIETDRNFQEGEVVRLDIADDLAAKHEALACHASQLGKVITDDPTGFALSADHLALFMRSFETFIAVKHPDA